MSANGVLIYMATDIVPFVMPYRDLHSDANPPGRELRDLARWCNRQNLRKACTFGQYRAYLKRRTEDG